MNDCLSDFLWARGMTLEQLADQSGVDAWTITCWAKGDRRPQNGKLRKVANVLGERCEDLLALLEAERGVKDECLVMRRSRECRTFLRLVGRGVVETGSKPRTLLKRLHGQRKDLEQACAALERQLALKPVPKVPESPKTQATPEKSRCVIQIKRRRKPQIEAGQPA